MASTTSSTTATKDPSNIDVGSMAKDIVQKMPAEILRKIVGGAEGRNSKEEPKRGIRRQRHHKANSPKSDGGQTKDSKIKTKHESKSPPKVISLSSSDNESDSNLRSGGSGKEDNETPDIDISSIAKEIAQKLPAEILRRLVGGEGTKSKEESKRGLRREPQHKKSDERQKTDSKKKRKHESKNPQATNLSSSDIESDSNARSGCNKDKISPLKSPHDQSSSSNSSGSSNTFPVDDENEGIPDKKEMRSIQKFNGVREEIRPADVLEKIGYYDDERLIVTISDSDSNDDDNYDVLPNNTGSSLVCHRCPTVKSGTFKNKKSYLFHTKRHKIGELFRCPTCRKSFHTLKLCLVHEIVEHETDIPEDVVKDPDVTQAMGFMLTKKKEREGEGVPEGMDKQTKQKDGDGKEKTGTNYFQDFADSKRQQRIVSSTTLHPYKGPPVRNHLESSEIQLYHSHPKGYKSSTIAAIAVKIHKENVENGNDTWKLGRFSNMRDPTPKPSRPKNLATKRTKQQNGNCDSDSEQQRKEKKRPNRNRVFKSANSKIVAVALRPVLTRVCSKCTFSWSTEEELREHRNQEHPNDKVLDLISVAVDPKDVFVPSSKSTRNEFKAKKKTRNQNEISPSNASNSSRKTTSDPKATHPRNDANIVNARSQREQEATPSEQFPPLKVKECSVRLERLSKEIVNYYMNKKDVDPDGLLGLHFLSSL